MSLTSSIIPLCCILSVVAHVMGQVADVNVYNVGQRLEVDGDVNVQGNLTGATIAGLLRENAEMKGEIATLKEDASVRDAQNAVILQELAQLHEVVFSTTTESPPTTTETPTTTTTTDTPTTAPEVVYDGDITVTQSNWETLIDVTRITGNLRIVGQGWMTDMSFLQSLTSVGGYLNIVGNNALTSLTGLESVTSVGGYLNIYNNDALTSLTGLDSVTSVGGWLQINHNDVLTDISALSNVTEVLGAYVRICSNAQLSSIPNFYNVLSQGKTHSSNCLRSGNTCC